MQKHTKRTVSWLSVLSLLLTMVAACGLVLPMTASAASVYYSENFDSYSNGTLPGNWTISSDSGITDITVQDGALIINGIGTDSQTRVFYTGSELSGRGDYVFEADYTILQADKPMNESTRYTGMIFRTSSGIAPYYYATTRVRTGTTDNELSIRTASTFKKMSEAPAPFDQALNTTYRLKVICNGPSIQFFVNDSQVFDTVLDTTGGSYQYLTSGGIGFTTSNLKIKIDNIVVTECTSTASVQPTMYNTYIPDTNIVNPPSVITEVTSADVYATLTGTKLPSTAIYYLNSDLNIITPDGGTVIASLASALNMTGGKVIPALYIQDNATADALAVYAESVGLKDAFLVSHDVSILKYARDKNVQMYGVLYTKLTSAADADDLAKIYANTNMAWAKTAMVDAKYLSKDDVEYLQKRLINVWTIDNSTSEEKYHSIYKGVNGIVDTNHANTIWIYESGVFNDASDSTPIVIRAPFLYAHRGYSSYANQNTMEAFYGAALYGADLIEMDVRLTSDGVVVIYHDEYLHTLTTCTDTTKKVENSTYAELMTYEVDNLAAYGYPNGKIATLREFLELIDQTDIVGIVEIKNYDTALVDKSAAIIKEMGMEDQVVSICFGQGYCERMRANLPGVSVGWLAGGVDTLTTPASIISYAKGYIMKGNLSYHPNYGQIQTNSANSMMSDVTAFGGQRGINYNPWTYNTAVTFDTAYVSGIQGITTDYLEFDNNYVRRIDAGLRYELKEGTATAVQGLGYTSQDVGLYNAIVRRTGGSANVSFSNANGKVTATGTGRATAVLMYKTTTSQAGSFYVISDLASINVSSTGGATATMEYHESLLPPYVEKWQNSINNMNIDVVRDSRGDVLTNTTGSWPAVTYTMTETAENNSLNGVKASLNDSLYIDAVVGDKLSFILFLNDGTNYTVQKYIDGAELYGEDLVGNGKRIQATVKLSDMIPASSATNGNVTITGVRLFNIGAAGTEITVKALDLVREVPAMYGALGDANSDGSVNTSDVRTIINSTIGKATLDYRQAKVSDIDGDGSVSSSDARTLLLSVVS